MRSSLFSILTFVLSFAFNTATAQDQSSHYTEPYQKKALEIYRDSIAFRSAAGHAQVIPMAEYLAGQFRDAGFPDEDIHILPFETVTGETIASLVVRYRGDGSSGLKPILLTAHMDVVDALPKDWERDPFTLIEEDGYFFGRGTSDDKFGTTILTATFLRLKAQEFTPTRDLIIAFTGDEETDMLTIRELVTTHRQLTDAEFALNADAGGGVLNTDREPVAYNLQAAEKTYVDFRLTIRNPGGHSSRPREDNAIYELADVLNNIQSYQFPVRSNEITLRYFELMAGVKSGDVADAMRRFSENPHDEEAANTLSKYPSIVGVTRTTCVATMLDAGHALNALPQSASANINCRIFPGDTVEEVRDELVQVANNPEMQLEVLGNPQSAPASPLREDVMSAVTKAVNSLHDGTPVIPNMSTGATDGREMRANGIPAYGIMGNFSRVEDSFAHGLNERVLVEGFFGALEFWNVLLHDLAGR